jgi:hypothetical protein
MNLEPIRLEDEGRVAPLLVSMPVLFYISGTLPVHYIGNKGKFAKPHKLRIWFAGGIIDNCGVT